MYVSAPNWLGEEQTTIDMDRAIRLNRQYAHSLGWQAHRSGIQRFLGLTTPSDDTAFAEAVARWQKSQNLTVDGIIGADTWSLLQAAMRLLRSPVPTINVDRAMRLNRQYARSLGWQGLRDQIAGRLLRFTTAPDDRAFAREVARWQGTQGLAEDGIVGPDTWLRMKAALAPIPPQSPRPESPPPRVSLEQVVRRALRLLGQQGRVGHVVEVQQTNRLRCLLNLLLGNPRADTQYMPALAFPVHPDAGPIIHERLTPSQFEALIMTVRRDLTSQLFAPTKSNRDFLINLDNLEKNINGGRAIVNRHMQGFGGAASPGMIQINDWIADRQRDPNSIYSCFGGVRD